MEREFVKKWLKVDEEDDDVIDECMAIAKEYIEGAVGTFDDSKARMRALYLAVAQYVYDNRAMFSEGNLQITNHPVVTSLIRQLQIEGLETEDEDG